MRHPVVALYIRLLVTQKNIVNNYLKDNIQLKSKIERFLQLDNPFKIHPIETELRTEALEFLNIVNIDIETAILEKQTLDNKITAILASYETSSLS